MNCVRLSENIYEIDSFLSENECKILISVSESLGYSAADVQVNVTRRHIEAVRNNYRLNYQSASLAEDYWSRLKCVNIPAIENRLAIGLSPYFRFYRYCAGQKFNMHKDGRQDVGVHETLFSFIIYLNKDYDGGSTLFRQDNIEVFPQTGKVVVFEHHLWHQGSRVESGLKYVLRTDVVCSG
ncbi:hypothetical protein MNBD_GAMMA12-2871 [hydrothermal vent metagenome]|uniref:Prolyl 4-hydroxylase alpha subunit domain-containing protein n=1 Tax=hydrothermal vent metagenome TaxID=652676 RepID=A0A3B0ZNU9_9ZZZZ